MSTKKPPRKGRKVDQNGRSHPSEKHVRLHQWMMQSRAWLSLDSFEARLLIELYSFYNGNNNGHLFLSVRKAATRCNMSKDKASASFRTLEERGFIRSRAEEPENFNLREARCWILTEFEFAGQSPTKDFMNWCPDDEESQPKSRTLSARSRTKSRLSDRNPGQVSDKSDTIIPFPSESRPANRTQL